MPEYRPCHEHRGKQEDSVSLSPGAEEREFMRDRVEKLRNEHPFSPYSDINVRDSSLKGALESRLFRAIIEGGLLKDDHNGGCVLFEKRDQVIELYK